MVAIIIDAEFIFEYMASHALNNLTYLKPQYILVLILQYRRKNNSKILNVECL